MHEIGLVDGFLFSGVACGIKANGALDLGLVHIPNGATLAGVYTRNQVVAAPVVLSRDAKHNGQVNALIVNSGNANACTGSIGDQDASEMVERVASTLHVDPETVQICSTGVIGQTLPMTAIRKGIVKAASQLRTQGVADFVESIRTTDLYRKVVRQSVTLNGQTYVIQGIAKGAGMIAPDMATMLAYVFSDAPIDQPRLKSLWHRVCDKTFNAMSVDGDTSTNDTALILCSGPSEIVLTEADVSIFEAAVLSVCDELAHLIIGDGEGATKAVKVHVQGARSTQDARTIANVVARSPLVKTALHGEDPNWGRIIAAVGRAGIAIKPNELRLSFEATPLYEDGKWCGLEAETAVIEIMKKPRYQINIDLKSGDRAASVLMCDLTAEYVRINADYRS